MFFGRFRFFFLSLSLSFFSLDSFSHQVNVSIKNEKQWQPNLYFLLQLSLFMNQTFSFPQLGFSGRHSIGARGDGNPCEPVAGAQRCQTPHTRGSVRLAIQIENAG